ncbi:MAG: dTDP-glucose 4,6-dehydratase [Chloroflexi bacterium]|nr:dTDP-glucose 4,6-dehydratase [Chloroflexota bacterium]
MKTLLITGGAGFIGSNLVRYLLQTEPQARIINLDALTYAGSLDNLHDLPDPQRHIFIHGDICDRPLVDDLLRRYAVSVIIHLAAETHVDRSIHDPHPFVHSNVIGTFTLLEAARQYWLAERAHPIESVRFHHVSTDEVFGMLTLDDEPFSEATPYAPSSPYSASKAASDHFVRAYHHTYGLPVTLSNCTNNYGPNMFPEKLIPLMILNALDGRPLPIYGDGGQIRDWLYVEDHCEAIWRIVQRGRPGETYCIGGNNQPTNLTVVKTLCEIFDECLPESAYTPHEQLIRFVADRPGHDRRYAMDIAKIQEELGWQPRQSLAGGLLKTVEWYLAHPDWLEAIRQKPAYQKWLERNYADRGEQK